MGLSTAIFGVTVRRSFIVSKDSRASHHILLSHQPSFDCTTLRTRLRHAAPAPLSRPRCFSTPQPHFRAITGNSLPSTVVVTTVAPTLDQLSTTVVDAPLLIRTYVALIVSVLVFSLSQFPQCHVALCTPRHEDLLSSSSISSYFSLTEAVDHDCLVFFVRAFRPA